MEFEQEKENASISVISTAFVQPVRKEKNMSINPKQSIFFARILLPRRQSVSS